MRRTLLAVAVLVATTSTARAAETPAADADPMAGWRPPKIQNEKKDRAEIAKLFTAMHAASKKGDVEAAAALIDFPILMLTDDSKGEAHAASWTREQWVQVMAPFYKPMPEMKITEKPSVFLMTDSLATVTNVVTIAMGKKKPMTARNSMLLARVGGEWKVKAMVEGGWGEMAGPPEGVSTSAGSSEVPEMSGAGGTTGSSGQTAPSSAPSESMPPGSSTGSMPSGSGAATPSTDDSATGTGSPPGTPPAGTPATPSTGGHATPPAGASDPDAPPTSTQTTPPAGAEPPAPTR